jgi:hypothetical protein
MWVWSVLIKECLMFACLMISSFFHHNYIDLHVYLGKIICMYTIKEVLNVSFMFYLR